MGVAVENVFFGNFIRSNEFLCHYKIDKTAEWFGHPALMKYYFMRDSMSKHSIFVDFEHDRSKMTIVFPIMALRSGRSTNQRVETVVKLEISYSTVRRIFCEVCTLV